jgi:hypothetical protein
MNIKNRRFQYHLSSFGSHRIYFTTQMKSRHLGINCHNVSILFSFSLILTGILASMKFFPFFEALASMIEVYNRHRASRTQCTLGSRKFRTSRRITGHELGVEFAVLRFGSSGHGSLCGAAATVCSAPVHHRRPRHEEAQHGSYVHQFSFVSILVLSHGCLK